MKTRALNKNIQSGFTIIEVMIVLAIAGVIMLMVFLAVPALQRNNRNTQLRSDVGNLLGYVSEYTSNNNGALPTAVSVSTANGDVTMNGTVVGKIRTGTTAGLNNGTASPTNIVLRTSSRCNGNAPQGGAGARSIVAEFYIETSGGTTQQCVAN